MGGKCPLEIAAYGKCVMSMAEVIDKGVCQKEFDALRSCFNKTRGLKK